jgi:hypothetical protein
MLMVLPSKKQDIQPQQREELARQKARPSLLQCLTGRNCMCSWSSCTRMHDQQMWAIACKG